jgi:hypothetical protein
MDEQKNKNLVSTKNQKRKKKTLAAGRGHVMSLSHSDTNSLFWLSREKQLYPKKMKFPNP